MTATLEVGGDLKLPGDAQPNQIPLRVAAEFRYFERELPSSPELPVRTFRHYEQAAADIQVGTRTTESRLSEARRRIAAGADAQRVVLGSPLGQLTRDELELIDILAPTLVLDRLLPQSEVSIGESWSPASEVLAQILRLDAVSSSDVECRLSEVSGDRAQIALSGTVHGASGGLATEIDVTAKLVFDCTRQRVIALGMAVNEKRAVGHVQAGLDVVARLKLQIAPAHGVPELSDSALEDMPVEWEQIESPLLYESTTAGIQMLHDRRWHVTRDDADLVVMRYVDRGELIAQCNVAPLSKANAAQPVTLAQFQADVRKSLGNSFAAFDQANERTNAHGLRVLRTVVQGTASELPIQWIYYLVSDEQGRQASLAFTMEQELADRFADADRLLIDSLQLKERQAPAVPQAAASIGTPRKQQ